MTSTAKFVSTRRPLIIHFVFDRSRELLVRQKDTLKNEYGEPLHCHITKLKYLTDVGVMRFRNSFRPQETSRSIARDMGFGRRLSMSVMSRSPHEFGMGPILSQPWRPSGAACGTPTASLCLDPAVRD